MFYSLLWSSIDDDLETGKSFVETFLATSTVDKPELLLLTDENEPPSLVSLRAEKQGLITYPRGTYYEMGRCDASTAVSRIRRPKLEESP